MVMLYAGLILAVLFFASAMGVYLYARRKEAALRETEGRRRAILDDFGDLAVWQMGQRATIAMQGPAPAELAKPRRAFLARLTVGLLVLLAGRRATPTIHAQSSAKILAWEVGHPERRAWSNELRKAIRLQFTNLEEATDIEDFAPGYAGFSTQERVDVWATLFVAMASFETTNYDPTAKFPEKSGVVSVGLFQLSYENEGYYGLEPLDREGRSLEDPLVNIRSGVKIFAVLVARDGVIASGTGSSSRGPAKYWRPLWSDKKLSQIQRMVRKATAPPQRHADAPHGDSR